MNMVQPLPAETARGWRARLDLRFALRDDGTTILAENRHVGPLRVQQPLFPEGGVCHACILHPPGGVVGGDRLELEAVVEPGSHALITTPGATKFYRSGGRPASQRQYLQVRGGTLEWFPQDNIIFPGAEAEIATEVHLTDNANFIGWEVLGLGLPTRGELFDRGRLASSFVLYRDGVPLFFERLVVEDKSDLESPAGLRNRPVTGTMLATGVEASWLEEVNETVSTGGDRLLGMTLLDDLLVVRYLGAATFEARELLEKIWSMLRPRLLGRPPCPPRIWRT